MDTSSFFIYPTVEGQASGAAAGFLDNATEREWDALLSYMQTRHLRSGETLFREGAADRALYLLTAGRLELSSTRTPATPAQAPAPLNELAFLDGGPCDASARAVTPSEVARLSFEAFESLAAREPHLGRTILLDLGAILARRLRTTAV